MVESEEGIRWGVYGGRSVVKFVFVSVGAGWFLVVVVVVVSVSVGVVEREGRSGMRGNEWIC